MQVTTIGLDIAKNVFQVHGIDAAEKVVVRKQLRRRQVLEFFKALPACLVGMEACGTAHYWARELTKLGHRVRLMPAKDVKAYVKRNKNDAADAEAICEAARRPTVRSPRSQRPSRIRRFLDRVVTSRPGSGSCRAKTRLAANRSSGRSRNGAIAICDEFWWSEPAQCCDTRAISRISILGSQSFSNANRSRWSRWRLLTRWRASPGRCWPRATPIGCLRLRPRRKE